MHNEISLPPHLVLLHLKVTMTIMTTMTMTIPHPEPQPQSYHLQGKMITNMQGGPWQNAWSVTMSGKPLVLLVHLSKMRKSPKAPFKLGSPEQTLWREQPTAGRRAQQMSMIVCNSLLAYVRHLRIHHGKDIRTQVDFDLLQRISSCPPGRSLPLRRQRSCTHLIPGIPPHMVVSYDEEDDDDEGSGPCRSKRLRRRESGPRR